MKVCIKLRKYETVWDRYISELKKYAEVEVVSGGDIEIIMDDVSSIITTKICENDIKNLPNLKNIFLFKTGKDGLPEKIICDNGIAVYPSYANADIIGEHAIALAFALLHRIVEFDCDLRNDSWFSDGNNYYWTRLADIKVGILGYGHIGQSIYKQISGFTSQIKVLNKTGKYLNEVDSASNLSELLQWSDIVFVCVPKTKETIGLIGKKELELLENKYVVNVSRAEICDEEALFIALKNNKLRGYASDVWYCSPDKNNRSKKAKAANYSFQDLKNVIMSPHCSTHEISAHEKYIADAVNQCIDYIKEVEKHVGI